MEPETSASKLGPEQAPIDYGPSIEHAPQFPSPERGLEAGAERYEQVAETAASAADAGAPTMVLPTPVTAANDPTASTDPGGVVTPAIANDDDLIEKEWVDRAKKIVADTRSDPYGQEKAVGELQKDYLKKRYGRELGGAQ